MILHIFQSALAILLFYLINWVGEHSSSFGYLQLSMFNRRDEAPAFNFLIKSLAPSVYIVLVSTALVALNVDALTTHIWRVAIYYFGFRFLFNLTLGRALLINWLALASQSVAGCIAAYFVYVYLVMPRRPLIPSLDTIGNELWIAIALFVYAVLNNVRTSNAPTLRRKNNYLRRRFLRFRRLYGSLIEGCVEPRYIELVTYAVLIYEDFNRPWVVRQLERIVFPWGSKTLGPMQVHAATRISDEESVRQGVRRLQQCFLLTHEELREKKDRSRYTSMRLSLAKYNRDESYISGVFELVHDLWAQVAPEYRTEFERMYDGMDGGWED